MNAKMDIKVLEMLLGLAVAMGGYIGSQINAMHGTMSDLNAKIAQLLERTASHDSRIQFHEGRIASLEKRR